MMTADEARKFLEEKTFDNAYRSQQIQQIKSLRDKQARQLGLLIFRQHKERTPDYTDMYLYSRYDNERYTAIGEIVEAQLASSTFWKKDFLKLLEIIVGKENTQAVKHGWDMMEQLPYQSGYHRRSFRAPNHPQYFLQKRIRFMSDLPDYFCYNFELSDYVRYAGFSYGTYDHPRALILAAGINAGDQQLKDTLLNIVNGKDDIGQISTLLIRALLLSDDKACWDSVEKLLLTAQREEGLRQTILESLDEVSLGAMQQLMATLAEHKLTRFSSVVRALDVWTGLNWESIRGEANKRTLELGVEYLQQPEKIAAAINDKNNLVVYMALWAAGVRDIHQALEHVASLLKSDKQQKRMVALYFLAQTALGKKQRQLAWECIDAESNEELYWVLINLDGIRDGEIPDALNTFEKLLAKAPTKPVEIKLQSFPFPAQQFSTQQVYKLLHGLCAQNRVYWPRIDNWFEDIKDADIRSQFVGLVFQDYATRYGHQQQQENQPPLNDFQRQFAFKVLHDTSINLREIALKALDYTEPKVDEKSYLEGLLKGGNGSLRQAAINLLLKQEKPVLQDSLQQLLMASGKQQRLAGLAIVRELKDKKGWQSHIQQLLQHYQSEIKLTAQEKALVDELQGNITPIREYTLENGFGLFDVTAVAQMPELSTPTSGYFVEKILGNANLSRGLLSAINPLSRKAKSPYSLPAEQVRAQLDKLDALIKQYKDVEILTEDYNHTMKSSLLGANDSLPHLKWSISSYQGNTKEEIWQNYGLHEVWEQWYQESGLTPVDLQLIKISFKTEKGNWSFGSDITLEDIEHYPSAIAKVVKQIVIQPFAKPLADLEFYNLLRNIIRELAVYTLNDDWLKIQMDACEWIYTSIPKSFHNRSIETFKSYRGDWQQAGWANIPFFRAWYVHKDCYAIDAQRFWNLHYWRYRIQYGPDGLRPEPYGKECYQYEEEVNIERWCQAYQNEYIEADEMHRALLSAAHRNNSLLGAITAGNANPRFFGNELTKKFPFLVKMVDALSNRWLDIEMARSEAPTDATFFCNSLGKVFGLKRFQQLLEQLSKKPLKQVYCYGNDSEKIPTLIRLLSVCYPLEQESQEDFNTIAEQLKLTDKRWVEIAMFTPQWRNFIMDYLGWEGMDSAISWLDAHSCTYQNDSCDARIGKYTSITTSNFADGVVDVDWFNDVYHKLGKKRWDMLYTYAKFVGDGSNGHARAKLYADVILGNTKIREVTKRIDDKRNKNSVMAYGLIPLSKANPENDMLKRYQRLQAFIKESKQFGAQRQRGEARAVEISLENLARTAGYTEPLHFIWNMEAKQTRKILQEAQQVQIDDLYVDLIINKQGKASLQALRGEKMLKNVPAKQGKNKQVVKLKEYVKSLNEQAQRARKSLEISMVRGDQFPASQLQQLMQHPIIEPMLKDLVLVSDDHLGFWQENSLQAPHGENYSLESNAKVRIAHCADLYNDQHWSDYQHHCFSQKRIQPFKQIFRELYRPTQQELEEVSRSNRYAGHQVQPKKAAALLKSRGWTVGYEEGLHKVDHQHGLIGYIYAMADWLTPAETEYPTLEHIEFRDRKTYKTVSLKDVPERVFSEFMRDVDLVVSVAHAGGVDPETSLSSIEMRQVLAEETAQLFKIKNIEIDSKHIKIIGKLAEYSLHLGSGIIHRMPGGHIAVIPVHAQHRGRLFLPFLDDDPKSAEILSKMVMLANDHKIKDPTILQQIQDVNKR